MAKKTEPLYELDDALGVDGDTLQDVFYLASQGHWNAALSHIVQAQRAIDVVTAYCVREARADKKHPLSWDAIGHALGVTRQAAHARFSA